MGVGRHVLIREADLVLFNQFVDPVRGRFTRKAFHGIEHGHADRTADGVFGYAL